MPSPPASSRRGFLGLLAAGALGLLGVRRLPASTHCHVRPAGPHPEPRSGIDGSKVLTADRLPDDPAVVELYDGIRVIPQIADGILCPCGCAEAEAFRSLLVCFEENGMATYCEICQTVGRMAVRYHRQGRTLDQIRAGIDARFG